MFIGLNNAITGLTQDQLSKTINSLFSKNEQGVWYDPSDLSTLFQDVAGTIPVTAVEQPVGLILDKSKGLVLGPELVPGTILFTNDSTYSFQGYTQNSPTSFTVTDNSDAFGAASQTGFTFRTGVAYKVSFRVTNYVSGSIFFEARKSIFGGTTFTPRVTVSRDGTYTVVLPVLAHGDGVMYFGSGATNCSLTVDNISVRELPGNHAYQSTSASRPVLSARVNLLTYTEQFDNAAWVKTNVTVTPDAAIAPDGTMNADKLIANTGDLQHYIRHAAYVAEGVNGTSIIYAKAAGITSISCAASGAPTVQATYNLDTGTITASTGGVASITSVGNGWYKCSFVCTTAGYNNTPYWFVGSYAKYVGDGTSGIYIWGADLRPTNSGVNLPPYQRVGASTDYDTAGFPHYLKFDGIDDSLVTNNIDFTSTDKMTVVAGVRKLSDAAVGVVAELSANWNLNEGTFTLLAPPSAASSRYYFGSKGTAQSSATILSGYAAPITNVFSGIGDIFAPNAALRVNGTQVAQSTATQGTGNFGNYPLYIGRRGGTFLPFNGQLYGLVIRGALSSTGEIQGAESYMNLHTGAY